ncbi:MAG: hypothetical protein Q9223_001945 [Gallowayella weberi]
MVLKLSKTLVRACKGSKQEVPTSAKAIPHVIESATQSGGEGLLNGTAAEPESHSAKSEDIVPEKTQEYQTTERGGGWVQADKGQLGQIQRKKTSKKVKLLDFIGKQIHHLRIKLESEPMESPATEVLTPHLQERTEHAHEGWPEPVQQHRQETSECSQVPEMKDHSSQSAPGGAEKATRSSNVAQNSRLSNPKTSHAQCIVDESLSSQSIPAEMMTQPNRAENNVTGNFRTLAPAEPEQPASRESIAPEQDSQGWLERVFKTVLYLPNERTAQRMTFLDSGSDFDVVSQKVVDDFNLPIQPYTGVLAKPLGSSYMPEGEITLSWHVSGFHKTYTTKFVVFSKDYSEDFDILLGRFTIKEIGFYKKNGNIWLTASDDREICVSKASNAPESRD